jgi:hypothetical protein
MKRNVWPTLIFIVLTSGCGKREGVRNVCPIDGAAPEWKGRRNGNSCEYLHYNSIERQTHSWWAPCDLTTPEKNKIVIAYS